MGFNKKYKITIEDETSLQKKVDLTARLSLLVGLIFSILIVACIIGMFIIAYSPMKNYLPGYMKESERTATEEQHLRLDSLTKVYEVNEAYVKSILNALNPPDKINNIIIDSVEKKPIPLKLDSIIPLTEEEKSFMENIRERDKYSIPPSSSAAAQTIMFGSVNNSALITEESLDKYQAEILIPIGKPISTVAEGKVISLASSPRYSGAYEIIIQHPNGFLSKTSRLSNIMVNPGDHVSAGQIIASGTTKNGSNGNKIIFELWHDGNPLIPSQYIKGHTTISSD